jgi:hypothetical protein
MLFVSELDFDEYKTAEESISLTEQDFTGEVRKSECHGQADHIMK